MAKAMKISVALLLLLVLMVFWLAPGMLERSMNVVERQSNKPVSDRAQALHNTLIIGDWHADSALWARNLAEQANYGQVDLPRLQQGNVALQMFTAVTKSPRGQNYVSNETGASDNITLLAVLQRWPVRTWDSLFERALLQGRVIRQLASSRSDEFRLLTSRTELESLLLDREKNPRLVGGLLGTEGSHALDGSLGNIRRLFDAGFRMMSLHHFFDNRLGGSLHGTSGDGLTAFGVEAVKEMQRLSIVVDVSHSSEQVVKDVLSISEAPLVVSHTGFRGHCDSPRNISDDLMQQIAAAGGLIAVGYWDGAICDDSPDGIAGAIKYGIELVGSKHVALGSDFDGSVTTSFDTSELVLLTDALLRAGVSEADIRGVMGGNMLQFLLEQLPE